MKKDKKSKKATATVSNETMQEVRRAKNNKQGGDSVGSKGRVGYCGRCQAKVKGGGNDHDSSLPAGEYSTKCSVPKHARKLVPTPEYDAMRQNARIKTESIKRGEAVASLNKGKRGSRPQKKKTEVAKK